MWTSFITSVQFHNLHDSLQQHCAPDPVKFLILCGRRMQDSILTFNHYLMHSNESTQRHILHTLTIGCQICIFPTFYDFIFLFLNIKQFNTLKTLWKCESQVNPFTHPGRIFHLSRRSDDKVYIYLHRIIQIYIVIY